MPRVIYILALLLCAPSYALYFETPTCPSGSRCGVPTPPSDPATGGDLKDKLTSTGDDAWKNALKQDELRKTAEGEAKKLRDRNAEIDRQIEKLDATKDKEQIDGLKAQKVENERVAKDWDGKAQSHLEQRNALAAVAGKSFAGANQLAGGGGGKSGGGGGVPFLPPPGGGNKGDDGGGGDKGNELKAVAVASPGPQPSPGALPGGNSANDQLLSTKEIAAAMEAKNDAADAARLKNSQTIAAMTQQSADMAAQTLALQKESAALRAKLSQQEMEGGITPRNSGEVIASNKTGSAGKSGSPFDLSPKNKTGAPSFGSEGSGAIMSAMKVTPTTPKQQASNRLLASATGSPSAADPATGSTAKEPAIKSGLAVKKASGPVYGRSAKSSTSSVQYKNMTVPQGLRTAMQTRIGIVGGATPENHQPPQTQTVAVKPASPPSSEGYAHARRNVQLLKAHIIIR